MKLHKESHTDHVSQEVLDHVLRLWAGYVGEFFIETVTLPESLSVECGLFGPIMGDDPVPEGIIWYGPRPGRAYNSRLLSALPRPTRLLTVIAGPHDGEPCVLYTAFGGPPSPKELNDPTLTEDKREESLRFWAEHALAAHKIGG